MNKQMHPVMRRREELLARIASQRGQMAEIGAHLQTPLAVVDSVLSVTRFLRSNPVLVAGIVAVLAVRHRGVAGAVSAIWLLWKRYSYIVSIAARLPSHFVKSNRDG